MLKIQLDDPGATNPIKIIENDRGGWMVEAINPGIACYHLTGFGGENILSIHVMEMQDGTASIVVLHNCVDNPIEYRQSVVTTNFDYAVLTDHINDLIAELCDYPEVL